MNTRNRGIRLSVLAVAAVLGFSGCSTEQQSKVSSTETVRDVSVLSVKQANIPDVLEAVGTMRAVQTSDLASQMRGNIVEIRVHEGDRVHRGQVLAIIDDSQPRAAVDRVEDAGTTLSIFLVEREALIRASLGNTGVGANLFSCSDNRRQRDRICNVIDLGEEISCRAAILRNVFS